MSRFTRVFHDLFPNVLLASATPQPQASPVVTPSVAPALVSTPRPQSSSVRPSVVSSSPRVVVSTPVPRSTSSLRVVSTPGPRSTPQPSPSVASPIPQSPSVRPVISSSSSIVSGPQPSPSSGHTPGPSQAQLAFGLEYQAAILDHHNAARRNHNAGPLSWDTECEANARLAAKTCTFEHYIPDGVRQGQNIFTTSGPYFNVTAAITEFWYKSELQAMLPYYGRPSLTDDVFHDVGHLTQMVWKGTTKVGCVSLDCGGNMKVNGALSPMNKYTVCNYAPPGNVLGRFDVNLDSPISRTNLGSWLD